MKIKKIFAAIIIVLVLLNVSQFLWYFNPLSFLGSPLVSDEDTAIAIARDFDGRLRGSNDGMVFIGEYIEGSGRWLVLMSLPINHFGRSYIFVVRARDGRVIEWRTPH